MLFWWRCGDPFPDKHDSTSNEQWTHLQVQPKANPNLDKTVKRQYGNFRSANGGFGPEIGLARHLLAKQNRQLAIVKVAFSGTSVAADWDPSGTGNRGACYRSLVSETKAAIKAAKAKGINLRLRALVWVQGESDANKIHSAVYEKNLGTMLESLRKDLNAPTLLGLNTHFGNGKNDFVPKIVETQKGLASHNVYCDYVNTSKADLANAAHFNTKGTLDVGVFFADALMKTEKKRGKNKYKHNALRLRAVGKQRAYVSLLETHYVLTYPVSTVSIAVICRGQC